MWPYLSTFCRRHCAICLWTAGLCVVGMPLAYPRASAAIAAEAVLAGGGEDVEGNSMLEARDGAAIACDAVDLAAADRFDSGVASLTQEMVGDAIENFAAILGVDLSAGLDFAFVGGDATVNAKAVGPIRLSASKTRPPRLCVGRGLIHHAMSIDGAAWDTALAGLFAHEFGHLRQMQDGTDDELKLRDTLGSVRLVELHADFLAGYALGQAYWIDQIHEIRGALRQFQAIGDLLFDQPVHHGDPAQRRAALASGLGYGLISPNDPTVASAEGVAFLSRQFNDLLQD